MGKIKGTVVCFCISLLAVCWPNGILGAPSCDPLLVQSYYQSSPISGDTSAVRRQQLLNQAKSLLDHLSSPTVDCSVDVLGQIPADDTPNYYALENLETSLLLTLVNRLNALESRSVIAADPTSSLRISEATFTSLANQYQKLKVLIANCMPAQDNQILQQALDDLYNTVVRIITGKLTKAELPNLCSKILTFNARLTAANAPAKVQDAVTEHIKSLTLALTGQSEVTISTVCSCLNDLETSVVTVVESDAPQRVQQLLSSLVNAVTNLVISGGGVDCNVIDVVKRYVTSINQAIQQDKSAQAKKIYSSVLSFEDELYKALIHSELTDGAVVSPSSLATLSENSASTLTQVDRATPLLSDATAILSNGATFIMKDMMATKIDEDGNVVGVVQSGKYHIFNPSTYASSSGSFAVQDGTIESSPDGSICLKSYGVYDVDLPSSSDKLQGNFAVKYNAVVQVDENGQRQLVESGMYSLTDPAFGITKSGKFIIVNSINKPNPDGSVEIIKSGVLSTSPTKQPSLDSDGVYFLCEEQVSKSGKRGDGIITIKKVETGNSETATLAISSSSKTTNNDGSVDKKFTGIYYVNGFDTNSATDNSNPSLILMNGADFIITIHEAKVTDSNGEVHIDRTGSLIETDRKTGIKKSSTFVYWNYIETENSDGSSMATAFSKFTSMRTIVPGTNPFMRTTSTSGGTQITDSAKPLTITENSLQALINSLNTGKAVQPAAAPVAQTLSTTDDSSWDVTSIFSDKTNFLIKELVTPIRDEQRNVIDQKRIGNYSFQNPTTNEFWNGPFEVTDFSLKTLLSGQVVVTKSGKFIVNSPADNLTSIEVQFLVVNIIGPKVDENGIKTIGEEGSYTVTVPEKGLRKFGTFVVTNRLKKAQVVDAVETITAGVLFVDNPDGSSSKAKLDYTKNDRYFLADYDFSITTDAQGYPGNGIYSLYDPNSNEHFTGTQVIQTYSRVDNSDGTRVVNKTGVSYVDGSDPKTMLNSVIINGAKYSTSDTYRWITDAYVDSYQVGGAVFDQFDSETGAMLSSVEIRSSNILINKNSDGSTTVCRYGKLITDSSSDSLQTTSLNTDLSQPRTKGSQPTSKIVPLSTSEMTGGTLITDSAKPSSITNNSLQALMNSLNTGKAVQPAAAPGTQTSSTADYPSWDVTSIFSDNTNFLIKEVVTPIRDEQRNVIDQKRIGNYSFQNPTTNEFWNGPFEVTDFSLKTLLSGQVVVTKSGKFIVNSPADNLTSVEVQFLVVNIIGPKVDENGMKTIGEEGSYTVTVPEKGLRKFGTFVVTNRLKKAQVVDAVETITAGVLFVDNPDGSSSKAKLDYTENDRYFLADYDFFITTDSQGNPGNAIYSLYDPNSNEQFTGTQVIQTYSRVDNSDGTRVVNKTGVSYVDGSDPKTMLNSVIINGAKYSTSETYRWITDAYVDSYQVGGAVFDQFDSETGAMLSSVEIRSSNILINKNSDGSTTVSRYGKLITDGSSDSLQTTSSNTDPSKPRTKGSQPTSKIGPLSTSEMTGGTLITDSAKPLSITKNSLQAAPINSLNTGKAVQPAAAPGTQTSSTADYPSWDVTSIFSDNTAFIIRELVTPIRDEQRNVINQERMGNYSFQNSMTNKSWTGPFEVTHFSRKKLLSGQIVVTKSGKFIVNSPADGLTSIEVQLLVVNIIGPKVDENGITTIGEAGSYTVTVPEKGLSKFGTFVVTNRLQKAQCGGAIETITAGLLFVDNPDGSSSKAKLDYTENDRYLLVEDHFFNAPDSSGNLGEGIYSLKNPNSNEQITGTRVIQTRSTVENSDGTRLITKDGVSYVDRAKFNSTSNSVIIHGAKFSTSYTICYVTSPDVYTYQVGGAVFDQFDSETGAILSSCRIESLSILTNRNPDGSETVTKFGKLIINDSSDSLQTTSLNTDPSQPRTKGSKPTSKIVPLSTSKMSTDDTASVSGAASINPATLVADGTSFIINKYLVPERDAAGNIVGIKKWGEFSLMDPNTNISYTGSFTADKSSTTSPAPGTVEVMESGTFVVNPPNDGSGKGQISDKISYSYQERVHKYFDTNGDARITDEGTYTLFNPAISSSAIGKFVVENTIFKTNPDGHTIITKSGILSLGTYCAPSSSSPLQTTTTDDSAVCTKTPIDPTAIVANKQSFTITKYLVPQVNSLGKTINMLKSGKFYLEGSNKGTSWKGRFFVNSAPTSSPAKGETVTKESGTYLVDASNDGTTPSNSEKKVNYSLEEHVIESGDGTSKSTDTGAFFLSNPITKCTASGTFVVQSTDSKTYDNGTTVVTKCGVLYVTDVYTAPGSESDTTSSVSDGQIHCTTLPARETILPGDRGYFLFNDHIFATQDSNGNEGIGFYSIDDPRNNEFTTGTYVLQEAFTVTNPDGSEDSKTAGRIFVNSARSSSRTENSDPILDITNGAIFSFDDHLVYVTDPNGNRHQVGTGTLTQTHPVTGVTRTGNYQILDILIIYNADGSTDIIESGTFMYTNSSTGGSTTTSTSSSSSSPTMPTGSSLQSGKTSTGSLNSRLSTLTDSFKSGTTPTGSSQSGKLPSGSSQSSTTLTTSSNTSPAIANLADLTACLETLTMTVNALKAQEEQASSPPNSITIPVSDVVAAANGQLLSWGHLVIVAANNGDALVGTLQQSVDTVTFRVINSADLAKQIDGSTGFVRLPENNFAKQYRNKIDALLNAVHPPCNS